MKEILVKIFLFIMLCIGTEAALGFWTFPVAAEGVDFPEKQDARWKHVGRQVELGQDGNIKFFRLTGTQAGQSAVGYNYYSLTNFSSKFGTLALDPSKELDFSICCRIISDKNITSLQSQGITIYYGAMDDGEAGSYRHSIRFVQDNGTKMVVLPNGKELKLDWSRWHTYKIRISPENTKKTFISILDDSGKEVFKADDVQTEDGGTYSYSDIAFGDTHSQEYESVWEITSVKIEQPLGKFSAATTEISSEKAPLIITDQTQFFIDNIFIANQSGCEKKIVQAKKYPGNPILIPDKPWEYKRVSLFGSVLKEDGVFRMWYFTGNIMKSREKGSDISREDNSFVCYATSKDGIHWEKPNLGIYEFKGSKANNIVMRHHGSHLDSICIMKASWEKDPAKKYKMTVYNGTWPYAGGYKKLGFKYPTGHFLYYSPDGIHWKMAIDRPILYLTAGEMVNREKEIWGFDASTFCVDEARKKYVGFIKRDYHGKRSRFFTESDDAIHWTQPELCLYADGKDPKPETQMYYNSGWAYESLWLGLNMLYYPGTSEAMIPELVYSRNGKNWFRSPVREQYVIELGKEGSWDSKMISIPSTPPIIVGNKMYIYYGGYAVRHDLDTSLDDSGAIGLAFLQKDRFVAMVAKNKGYIQTIPFDCSGGELEVNCKTEGSIKVEVIDSDGNAMTEYSINDCIAVHGDHIVQKIKWKSNDKLPAGKISLRFVLEKSEIYAFRIEGK